MNMKKTLFASAMALALASSSGWAAECANPDAALGKGENVGFTTYTCKGQFILDKTEVRAGETVNLALMGLDAADKVDRFGEQGGSVIMGVVNTVKGQINPVPYMDGNTYAQGSKTPGAKPDSSEPGYGSFASQVSYIRLAQGNGQVSIYYPPEATGDDILTLTLQERRATANGGVEFNVIAKAEKIVKIAPPSDNPMGLDIAAFVSPMNDIQGISDDDSTDGIYGKMTAGASGAEVHVKARNDRAAGPVTLTLTNGKTALTYSGKMVRGYAKVNLDSNVKLSGKYYAKAQFGTFAGSSVDMIYPDVIYVSPTGKPSKLKLTSAKTRISEKLDGGGSEIWGQLLDVYGNPTSNRTGEEVRFTIKDEKAIASGSALDLYVPAGDPNGKTMARSGDNILGNATGEVKEGIISLVATAAMPDGSPNSSISASDPVEIQVVKEALLGTLNAQFNAAMLAGNEFKAFTISTTDNGNPGQIIIKQLSTSEELTVNPNADKEVEALFKIATAGSRYLLSDKVGKYGQTIVDGFGIKTAATTLVELRNAHGEVQTEVAPVFNNDNKTYVTALPEIAFKMTDAYGNPVTPGIESVTGSFYLNSSNGTVAYNTPETDRGIPSRDPGYKPTVTYKATGEDAFVGEDTIGVTFTKPGLGTAQMQVKSAVAGINKLKEFKASIEQNKIPVNSEVALTVEAIGSDDDLFMGESTARVKFNVSEADGLLETFKVYEVYGQANSTSWGGMEIVDGQTLDFGMSQGRKVFLIEAGPVEGKFTLTFTDANETGASAVTQELEVTTQLVEPVCSATDPTACKTEAECTAANGAWDAATNSCKVKDTGCSAENPTACTTEESCVATGAAIYLKGYTNVTDGCYGVPTDPTETVANIIYKDGTRTPAEGYFAGGVLVDGKFSKSEKVSSDLGKVTIGFNYKPVEDHVGTNAHLLAVVGVESPDTGPIDGSFDTNYFGLSEIIGDFYPVNVYADNHADDEDLPEGQINQPGYWADEVAKLAEKPYLGNVELGADEQIVLVPGDLGDLGGFKGALYFFVGYMVLDGDDKDAIVFNDRPIVLIVE